MSERLPRHPSPEIQEDLQEAAFAALRRLLHEVKELPTLVRLSLEPYDQYHSRASVRQAAEAVAALLVRIDEALAGEPGRLFLEHMQRLEGENARLRGLLAAFEHCPHGCEDTPICPHYKKVRGMGLRP